MTLVTDKNSVEDASTRCQVSTSRVEEGGADASAADHVAAAHPAAIPDQNTLEVHRQPSGVSDTSSDDFSLTPDRTATGVKFPFEKRISCQYAHPVNCVLLHVSPHAEHDNALISRNAVRSVGPAVSRCMH